MDSITIFTVGNWFFEQLSPLFGWKYLSVILGSLTLMEWITLIGVIFGVLALITGIVIHLINLDKKKKVKLDIFDKKQNSNYFAQAFVTILITLSSLFTAAAFAFILFVPDALITAFLRMQDPWVDISLLFYLAVIFIFPMNLYFLYKLSSADGKIRVYSVTLFAAALFFLILSAIIYLMAVFLIAAILFSLLLAFGSNNFFEYQSLAYSILVCISLILVWVLLKLYKIIEKPGVMEYVVPICWLEKPWKKVLFSIKNYFKKIKDYVIHEGKVLFHKILKFLRPKKVKGVKQYAKRQV